MYKGGWLVGDGWNFRRIAFRKKLFNDEYSNYLTLLHSSKLMTYADTLIDSVFDNDILTIKQKWLTSPKKTMSSLWNTLKDESEFEKEVKMKNQKGGAAPLSDLQSEESFAISEQQPESGPLLAQQPSYVAPGSGALSSPLEDPTEATCDDIKYAIEQMNSLMVGYQGLVTRGVVVDMGSNNGVPIEVQPSQTPTN